MQRKTEKSASTRHPDRLEHSDRLVHEPLRLAILTQLARNEVLSFRELKELLDTSDGNLSVHARKLEAAGFLLAEKSFDGRTPRTVFKITEEGRAALDSYLVAMSRIIKSAKRH
jgi:DNA-binding MarR family transcriptional regulator